MTTPRKSILKAQCYDIPEYKTDYRLKLDLNESSIGPSPKVVEALKNIAIDDIKYYPAYGEVINKLAKHNDVCPQMIIPTSGADEAINYIYDTFLEPCDSVLAVTPSFAMPKIYADVLGCEYHEINYTKKFVFPIDEILSNIKNNTKLIIVTTPNNPTGEAISRENLLKILDKATKSYVLIDETYYNYADETFLDLLSSYSNIIIARSMSKDFGLAGLRFGYLIASQENINHIKKVLRPFSVNNITVKAAIAALEDTEHLNYVISQVKESKKLLSDELTKYAKKIYPSNANFLLIDFAEKAEFIYKKLFNRKIKIKNFGQTKNLENCLRISLPSVEDSKFIIECLKPRDLIIFDIDGVIIDTRSSYRVAIKETYKHFCGKDISFEEIQNAKNLGGLNNDWDLTEYLMEQSEVYVPKQLIIAKFQEYYWGNNGNGLIKNEEILISPEIIKNLSKDFDLAIFTGRPRQEADFILTKWNIYECFCPIVCMEDLPEGKHKPEPDGILNILNIVKPNKAYYLGDTPDDMISAAKAGITAIGVLPPQDKSNELKEKMINSGAANILENAEQILSIVKAPVE